MYNDKKVAWTIIAFFCIVFILAVFISLIASILTEKSEKETREYLESINYHGVVSSNFKALFDTAVMHQKITTSNQIVSRFAGDKTYDYLVKYFGFAINDETVDHLSNIYQVQKKAENFVKGTPIRAKALEKYTPSFSMCYRSPQGRSTNEAVFYFDTVGLSDLIVQINRTLERQNFAKEQRAAMTQELRDAIKRRDNWTCQRCGNSQYNEPNLMLEIDHIIPISKGGKTEPANLQTLCWKCNRSKSDKLVIPTTDFEETQNAVSLNDDVY